MSFVSTGQPDMADVEENLNRSGLGEIIYRNEYFERAGEEVAVYLTTPYIETDVIPVSYRARVVQGNKRANIRKGDTEWTKDYAYFISDTADVYADIAVIW